MHADPPTGPYRDRVHDSLARLETDVQAQSALVRAALARATRGLVTGNTALGGAVVTADDEVDRHYLDIERRVVDLLGRHAPVAADLRLLTAILHINLHLNASVTWPSTWPGSARRSPARRGARGGLATWNR
jgi:phosphate uptake regulator